MTISNLYAYSPTTFTAGQAVTVTVLDNGAPTVPVLACTVTGPGTGAAIACTSTATVTINPGDFLTVQIGNPATGTFVSAVWRVSFTV
jgi:hypothetical protein